MKVQITDETIDRVLEVVRDVLLARMGSDQYGRDSYLNMHEAQGVCLEEWHELVEEVKSNDLGRVYEDSMDNVVAHLLTLLTIVQWSDADHEGVVGE